MRTLLLTAFVTFAIHGACFAAEPKKAEPAKNADPLAKFSDEDLIIPGKCFDYFVAALAQKDAEVAKAFLSRVPKNMAGLNLTKESDRTTFFGMLAKFNGCTAVGSLKLAMGLGEVTYTDKDGKEVHQRMENAGGRWKIVLE